jgi:predicted DNA-binding protein
MPGQRKKGKKQVCVWLTPAEKSELQKAAKTAGKTMSEILKEKINEALKK